MKLYANVTIEGIKPLLINTFPLSILLDKQSKSGEEEWKTGVLMDENRQLFLWGVCFQNSIISGGKEIKIGRGNIAKKTLWNFRSNGNESHD